MDLCDINQIKSLLGRHGFTFSKALGQNFLCDSAVPEAIAGHAGLSDGTCVLEVGPGIGTLTRELCQRAKQVVAIELDKRLPKVLEETLAEFDNFSLVQGDVLKTDIAALCAERFGTSPVVACANLPYYITTPAITKLVESKAFDSITVMVQKEVAHRICAEPGTADYGAFTVYIQYYCDPELVLEVPREAFLPSPKVDSSVVRLEVRGKPPVRVEDETMFFRVVKAAFAQRRKTLLNCLSQAFGGRMTKTEVEICLNSCGVEPTVRGETLSIADFAKIANFLTKQGR